MASTTAIRQRIIPRAVRFRRTSAAFETQLGYMGILFNDEFLARVSFGHGTAGKALAALPEAASCDPMNLSPSQRNLQDRLTAFAAGEPIDFADVEVVPRWDTPFACRVVEICRAIPYGETLSYSEVAALAGSPGAARAVGNVMRSNHVPLVIPCHRVVGANGGLGGYSAEGGLAVKERLLAMERAVKRRRN